MIAESSFTYLVMGAFFGLTAGISPGPLLTLVITETLKHNKREGIKVAIAPLITDLPIIIVTFLVFSELSQFNEILCLISFSGGIFIAWLGYETIKTKDLLFEVQKLKKGSFKKGITANFLNPHPYIFWITVGIPTAFRAYETNLITLIFFFLLFYTMLIGSKTGIALLVDRSKAFLKNKTYKITMKVLGIVLFLFSIIYLYDGIRLLQELLK